MLAAAAQDVALASTSTKPYAAAPCMIPLPPKVAKFAVGNGTYPLEHEAFQDKDVTWIWMKQHFSHVVFFHALQIGKLAGEL